MTLAWRFQARGHAVTLYEGAAVPGGLAAPHELGGVTWDRFYHVILLSDANLRGLLAELDLTDRLKWGTTRTGFFADGRLLSLSTSLEFLRFPLLNLIDKARLAATILRASAIRDGRPLEAEPVTGWLKRWSGRRTVERIWLPLLKSKLGENYRVASAAFIWAIIRRMYAARRSGLKRELFGYVDGGYAVALGRFRERLEAAGVAVRCEAPVARVEAGDTGGVRLTLAGGELVTHDDAVLTLPCSRVSRLCQGLRPEERQRLDRVTYQGIVCASLLLDRPLAGYYVTNITEPWVPFTAVIEMTALVDPALFGGRSLVYLPRYLTQEDPFWARSDEEIREEFVAALVRMYPAFNRSQVVAFQVSRVREVLAVSTLDYTERAMPPVRTSLPGVWVVNSAQIANGTLNLNETIGLANIRSDELAPLLGRSPAPTSGGER